MAMEAVFVAAAVRVLPLLKLHVVELDAKSTPAELGEFICPKYLDWDLCLCLIPGRNEETLRVVT